MSDWAEDTERHEAQRSFDEPCGVDDCTVCGERDEPRRKPTRQERLEAQADAGCDTRGWEGR